MRPPPPTTHEVSSKPPPPRRAYRPLFVAAAVVLLGGLFALWDVYGRRPAPRATSPSPLQTLVGSPEMFGPFQPSPQWNADLLRQMLQESDPRRVMLQTSGDEPLTPAQASVQIDPPPQAVFVQGLRRRTGDVTEEMLLYHLVPADLPPNPQAAADARANTADLDPLLQSFAQTLRDKGFHLLPPSPHDRRSRLLVALRAADGGRQVLTVRLARRGGEVRIAVALRYPNTQSPSR